MNRREEPVTFLASAPLTEGDGTGSPTSVSTATWMSLTYIGSARSASTWTMASRTQPGRRDRCGSSPAAAEARR
jgi:hypothetical protein